MKLIGMLNSPYVRRVAISLHALDIPFTHEPLSVFAEFDAFRAINPVVKAPTLVTDDGIVLMESGVILDYIGHIARRDGRLQPDAGPDLAKAARLTGLALTACEKTVQIVYEHKLRPPEKQYQPWLDRVTDQLKQAYRLLDEEIGPAHPWIFGAAPTQADITLAVAFRFTREMLPPLAAPENFPRLAAFSERAEATAPFLAWPCK
ncbi:glutathione S-transferase family protein [Acidomonas methanolica]|uniref:Glutathione S-transferase n=1 Tax=Acidomonas methanolica NBRC 104435 TaxID=1231351 RepID=A0A023D481_ACIMT|nr:glutathione S-transferase family protein [Acidomonas methanolica]MBU2654300.1 glutathione S-transferase family protein [Acidomonas methanolica]TCS29261.1 glutathione S-transferase [Acidomonas methanolica]GAJ28942.1 glutathione S-transferase [Acidomonas methanolica NBRC 104435]GEK99283.1 glutathione S-transferase [Acidomonas methanolica NBRC 104435]